eukprot:1143655-Pelagomonas_calceolata.AAC.4
MCMVVCLTQVAPVCVACLEWHVWLLGGRAAGGGSVCHLTLGLGRGPCKVPKCTEQIRQFLSRISGPWCAAGGLPDRGLHELALWIWVYMGLGWCLMVTMGLGAYLSGGAMDKGEYGAMGLC